MTATKEDIVQVVRCKDCRYFYPAEDDEHGNTCMILFEWYDVPLWVKEDDYCSRAERRNNETD